MTTFCWLPPDRVADDLIDAVAANGKPLDHVRRERGFARKAANAEARRRADRRKRDIVANR